MSSNTVKSREEVLAERQEKKKKKAALKNQPKGKNETAKKEDIAQNVRTEKALDVKDNVTFKEGNASALSTKQAEKTEKSNINKNLDNSVKEKENGAVNINSAEPLKTKSQLKAERRMKQEAERARKLEKIQATTQEKKAETPHAKQLTSKSVKVPTPIKVAPDVGHKVKLFAHLYDSGVDMITVDVNPKNVHPSIIQLEAQYSSKVVTGANACCVALLNALKQVVMDFQTPANQEFSRGLEAEITNSISYLSKGRPVAVSMVNAVKHLKFQITQSKGNELKCKNDISDWIDIYIKEQLEMAAKAICLFVREKIAPGDIILTYGCSCLIEQILISVHNDGISFQVIVVDGRPWLEGREMLKRLVSVGIPCTYVFVNGLSFIMPEVTKILLGAHALLANGYVMARAGSSQIALLAKTYNVPVLVCCETHKFSERVQTDSFVYNELGNPHDLASKKGCLSQELSKWKSISSLTPLNLTYDVTPPDLVSAVVTEIAVLPCTSVPVILRIKPPDVSC